jgi:hypothetical protein
MKECIIKNGDLWADCLDHENIEGGHGEFECIHRHESNEMFAPKFCKLKIIDFDIEELFVI